jgi:hypothetical protein
MQPLVVVDLSVWLHLLYARMGGDSGVRVPRSATDAAYVPVWKSAHRDGIIKAQLALLLGASYMGASSHDVVLVGDYKPYWRSEYLKRPETVAYQMTFKKAKDAALQTQVREAIEAGKALPEGWERLTVAYKGGRKFPEYRFNWLRTYVRNLLQEQGVHLWASEGYEADDYAAAFVRSAVARDRPMTLLTVDTDWLGLVSSDVQWVCMSGFSPRIRQGLAGLNEWAKARLGETFDTPTDLWEYKAKHGDKSDNLPAGSPIGVIDLLNRCLKQERFTGEWDGAKSTRMRLG